MAAQLSLPMWPVPGRGRRRSRRMILVLMGAVAHRAADRLRRRREPDADARRLASARAGRSDRRSAPARRASSANSSPKGLCLAARRRRARAAARLLDHARAAGARRRRAAAGRSRSRSTPASSLFTARSRCVTPLVFGVVPALRDGAAARRSTPSRRAARGATRGARPAPPARVAGGRAVRARVDAVGRRRPAGPQLHAPARHRSGLPRRARRHRVGPRCRPDATRRGQQVKAFYQQAVDAARDRSRRDARPARRTDRPLEVSERRTFTPDRHAQTRADSSSRVIAATWTAGSYFEALGIPLKRGRFFTDADGRDRRRASSSSARCSRARLWPDQDPVGRQIKWGHRVDAAARG